MTARPDSFEIDDPEIPATSLLLGEQAAGVAGGALTAMAGVELQEIVPLFISYSPGASLRIHYNVVVRYPDGDVREEDLVAVAGGDAPPGDTYRADSSGGPIWFWRYPWDPHLPGLEVGWDPASIMGMVEAAGLQPRGEPDVSHMSYSPGYHAVLKIDLKVRAARALRISASAATDRTLFLKIVRPSEIDHIQRAHVALDGRVPAPRCLAWSASLGLLLMDEVRGKSVWELLVADEPLPSPEAFLELMDRLAAIDVPGTTVMTSGAVAAHSAEILTAIMPEEAERVAELVAYYTDEEPQPLTTIHGDLHEDQALFAPDGTVAGILDLDEVGPGQQIDDMAMLVGRLWSQAPFHGDRGPAFERYTLELFDVFARRLGSGKELHRRCGACMFARATNPFRYTSEDWRAETSAILDECQRWIDDGPP